MNTQLNEPANQNSTNVPKVVKPTNKKTLGTTTSVISSQCPLPPSLSCSCTWLCLYLFCIEYSTLHLNYPLPDIHVCIAANCHVLIPGFFQTKDL